MTRQPDAAQRSLWPDLVLLGAAMAWLIGTPVLLYGTLVDRLWTSWNTTSAQASPPGWHLATIAFVVSVPLLGAVLAYVTERSGWQMFFVGALVLGVLGGAACSYDGPQSTSREPARDPLPTHCVERSGGGNECPGD